MKYRHPITRVYRFFKSIKLALILIGYLVVTSIIASLIPQGREPGFYTHEFSAPIYKLITTLNLNNFFRSLLFLVPLGIFTINLSVCTMDRLVTRIKHHAPLRLGPDIIHIGLLVLIAAGLITLFQRQEGFVFLSPGDSVRLPNGYELTLKRFIFKIYRDGRPKKWISEIELTEQTTQSSKDNSQAPPRIATIEVNRPLRLGNLNIFQYSYRDISTITLKDPSGTPITIHTGKSLRAENSIYTFIRVSTDLSGLTAIVTKKMSRPKNSSTETLSIEGNKNRNFAVFFRLEPQDDTRPSRLKIFPVGAKLGRYTITRITPRLESGLNVVYDPGFTPIIVGLLFVGFGLALTLIQKIGDNKL